MKRLAVVTAVCSVVSQFLRNNRNYRNYRNYRNMALPITARHSGVYSRRLLHNGMSGEIFYLRLTYMTNVAVSSVQLQAWLSLPSCCGLQGSTKTKTQETMT